MDARGLAFTLREMDPWGLAFTFDGIHALLLMAGKHCGHRPSIASPVPGTFRALAALNQVGSKPAARAGSWSSEGRNVTEHPGKSFCRGGARYHAPPTIHSSN